MARKRPEKRDEDLFRDTTMSFGEHLEELRMCLFKAIVGVVIGFLIGLPAAGPVVRMIEEPLKKALRAFQEQKSIDSIHAMRAELEAAGYPLPDDEEEIDKFIKEYAADRKFEVVYINPREVLGLLQSADPELLGENVSLPAAVNGEGIAGGDKLMRVFLWHDIEKEVYVTSLGAPEAFSIYIKAAFVVGLLIASPWVFYQIWSFVAAGLYPNEKRYVHVFLPFSLGLFLAGAALAFFFVFEPVLGFLFLFNDMLDISQDIRISDWLSFVLILPLGFGVAFQLPLVMLFLERIGIFDVKAYLLKWKIAILMIFTLSMLLTPADPYSMLLMAVPLSVLYFGGVLLCKFMPRGRSRFDVWDE